MALGTVVRVYLISGDYEFVIAKNVGRRQALDLACAFKYTYTYYLLGDDWLLYESKTPYPNDPWVQAPDDHLLKLIKMHVLLES